MIKKFLSVFLALMFVLGILPAIAVDLPGNAGAPEFEVSTSITPDSLSVYPGQPLTFTAATTYVSNKEHQLLQFVSERWLGVDLYDPAVETELELEPDSGLMEGARRRAFVSAASLLLPPEPGDYDVVVRYEITLRHDESGKRTYYTSSETAVITVTVMAGELPEEPAQEGQPLNHGQIVSAWAHWKQGKGNKNFLPGGPGVYRSLVWYKAQVEYGTFYSRQEVFDFLDSIYEPAPRLKKDNPNKGPGNNSGKGK